MSLTKLISYLKYKHLSGRHSQASHGRRSGVRSDKYSSTATSGSDAANHPINKIPTFSSTIRALDIKPFSSDTNRTKGIIKNQTLSSAERQARVLGWNTSYADSQDRVLHKGKYKLDLQTDGNDIVATIYNK